VSFMAAHADRRTADGLRWGVEPICRVLTEHGTPIAPSTFYDARDRSSTRQRRDEQIKAEIARGHAADYGSTAPARCGWRSTATALRWPAAPWSG
jgi:putative transposase